MLSCLILNRFADSPSTPSTLFPRTESADNLFDRLHPTVAGWFQRTHGEFTPAQKLCIPAILDGKSVLLSSPTGSGKTLAGFLGIIDRLTRESTLGEGIQAIYVSPLRALTYDIQKNLAQPLSEMGLTSHIRIALRTGDTPAKERAQIKRRPPHILLTTPESLAILLCQPTYHAALAACRYVIVDELHALAENKRGIHLSLSLERLERLRAKNEREKAIGQSALCRIGLSATISPLEEMAAFLVGNERPCLVAEAPGARSTVVEVFSPVRRNPYPPAGKSIARVLREVASLVRSRRSVLIFANTRTGAENLGMRLKEELPALAKQIEIHHSSLDRDVRLEVEDRLKNGELRAVVCSSSLEMGIDIGAIDLVIMISAPKGVARALQRIGRAGHSVHKTSHGILVATNINDLIECAATAKAVRERRLEPVRVQELPTDILAQHILGLAMEEPGISPDTAYAIVLGAYAYRQLSREGFDRVVEYLEGGGRSLAKAYSDTFGKIVLREGGMFTASKKVERDYMVNIGAIVTEGLVDVMLRRKRLGTVEEGFIKGLKEGDVFVLGGRAVRLLEVGLQTAKVEDAGDERPNVPVWSGSRMPLSGGLAGEIARMRGALDDEMRKAEDGGRRTVDGEEDKAASSLPSPMQPKASMAEKQGSPVHRPLSTVHRPTDWLVENWELSLANAQAIVAHFELQRRHSVIPRDELMLIELHREIDPRNKGLSHYFFHTLIGRGANDALSRIVAWRVAKMAGGNAMATADDYGFLLTLKRFQELPLERWRECFARVGAEDDLRAALRESELVRWQFRSVAQTGLMVPRQYPGKERAVKMLRFSAEILFRVLEQHEPDHPLLAEAYRQATSLFLDAPAALRCLDALADPRWQWQLLELPAVSPFGFGLYVSKLKEGLMFEDPADAVERLYRQFYAEAGGDGASEE